MEYIHNLSGFRIWFIPNSMWFCYGHTLDTIYIYTITRWAPPVVSWQLVFITLNNYIIYLPQAPVKLLRNQRYLSRGSHLRSPDFPGSSLVTFSFASTEAARAGVATCTAHDVWYETIVVMVIIMSIPGWLNYIDLRCLQLFAGFKSVQLTQLGFQLT